MKNLYTPNVDLTSVDNLVSGTLVPCKVVTGELAEAAGVSQRGTLLTVNDDSLYVKAKTGDDIDGVLLLDIDAADEDERIGAPIACSGEFNQNRIEEIMGGDIAVKAVISARKRQIYIAPMNAASEQF